MKEIAKSPAILKQVDKIQEAGFKVAKNDLFNEFENHPVTIELREGISSAGAAVAGGSPLFSKPLRNLASFLGLKNSNSSVSSLKTLLRTTIQFERKNVKVEGKNLRLTYQVNMPTEPQVESLTKMERLGGRSWALTIERGLIGYYPSYLTKEFAEQSRVFKDIDVEKYSRRSGGSGGAIQLKNRRTGQLLDIFKGGFTNVAYLSRLLNRFKSAFGARQFKKPFTDTGEIIRGR
ncbi:MAG: hypothetical protein AABY22_12310 [Nanoarchaeota archaeon]